MDDDDYTIGVADSLVENNGATVSVEVSAPEGYVFDEVQEASADVRVLYFKRK